MSHCIEKLSHSCGSSDGLQVFKDDRTDGYTGYCFVCDTYVPDPYEDRENKPKTPWPKLDEVSLKEKLTEISLYKTISLDDRKLKDWALDYFGIRIEVSEVDGVTPVIHYYPYYSGRNLVAYKARLIEGKKMWSIGSVKGADLFGWHKAVSTGAKRLYITEGELDAVALYQALKEKNSGTAYSDFEPAVVSLVSGASSAKKCLSENAAKIKGLFNEVVLVFDQDEHGQKAVKDAMVAYPSAISVDLPSVDPNACLMEGRQKALVNACLFKSSSPKNTRIIQGRELYEQGRQAPEWGLSWPFDQLTQLTRGIRYGETYYLGAGVKMGKSELVNALAVHGIMQHNLPVFLAKPEEANIQTWKKILGKVEGKIFHDPKVEFDFEAYDKATDVIGDRLFLLDLYQHMGWDSLKSDIISAATIHGCKLIFIDPITNLVNGLNAAETDTILKAIAQELAAMAKDLEVAIFIFCHLKSPDSGDSHERGGKVFSNQFAGSRAMMRSCNYMLGLEGNKDPDLPLESRNIRKLILLEDREFGESGVISLYWNSNTQLFHELKEREDAD